MKKLIIVFVFFFQAEDGIRDYKVTGVQTCALPISDAAVVATVPAPVEGEPEARRLVERSRRVLDRMHAEDREEAIELHEKIETAIGAGDGVELDGFLAILRVHPVEHPA